MSSLHRRRIHIPPEMRSTGERLFEEAFTLPSLRRLTGSGLQVVPLNVYETDLDLIVVAAMPGLQPEDIEVDVTEDKLSIHSKMRGSLEETKNYLRHEWHYGPYSRTIDLPFAVDASKANAAYGGGVLTVTLPKTEATRSHKIKLQRIAPARGEAAHHGAAEFAPEKHVHETVHRETAPLKRGQETTTSKPGQGTARPGQKGTKGPTG